VILEGVKQDYEDRLASQSEAHKSELESIKMHYEAERAELKIFYESKLEQKKRKIAALVEQQTSEAEQTEEIIRNMRDEIEERER